MKPITYLALLLLLAAPLILSISVNAMRYLWCRGRIHFYPHVILADMDRADMESALR